MIIKTKLIDGGKMPEYKTAGASCADCYSRLVTPFITIPNGATTLINLGFAVELPKGYEMVIRPRSGLSSKGIVAAYGTVDSDYRGEVKACITNLSGGDFNIKNLERICQIKIQPTKRHEFLKVDNLSETERGENGFGSTGVK